MTAGTTIAVFPEGARRSRGDRIAPLKKGSFHLVQLAQVPCVPIGIRGTGALMPRENTGIRGGIVEVHVGAPIAPPALKDVAGRAALMETGARGAERAGGVPAID